LNKDNNDTPKIIIRNIKKTFERKGKKSKEEFLAIDNVNLDIYNGEFLVILGPSGCGKSTLLDIIGGLSTPSKGEIKINDKIIEGPGLDRGIVFQQYALLPWRNALHNVTFPLESHLDKRESEKISKKYLSLVGLSGFEDRYPNELSGGMKQRVAIARALAIDPEILLMDEPFAAVDAQTRSILQEDLLKITENNKKTVIFITHSIDEAIFLADKVAIMTARPGTIKEIVNIPISRQHRFKTDFKSSSDFARLRHKIWELLKEEVIKSQEIKENNLEFETSIEKGGGI
jgi:NitT/TauT family transport system ATP-binding protein